ncbi:hypothetical protein SMSK564_1424 [Streptococcus mitis SK564]|uniref:Uncharacterized protein n=3 Tax=Streptococcus TaxID=1301 RepID=E1LNJ5_STRMT|nr:Rep family protein [Streptococcus mitis]EFN98262.1 hypothetical protein SMSK564_1424 [Streptococcus mitis SK564]MDU2395419.1 Rep family protein [Streptococcus mitis]
MSSEKKTNKKIPKQRAIMYTQQMRLAILSDWKEEIDRIVKLLEPLLWAGILHDKDVNEDGETVEPHIHLMMYFKHARSPHSIAWEINERNGKREDSQIERLEFFKHPNNGFSYLVHQTKDAQNKYQYPISEVISNFDFAKKLENIRKQVERNQSKKEGELIREYLDMLYDGLLTLEEIESELTGSQYAKASTRLKAVAEKRQERLGREFLNRMKYEQKTKQVVYIYGESGLGKTRLAKTYAENKNTSYFVTGSSRDPFQSYQNQETIIIDELRPDSFRYDDLLKILDPYNFDVFLPSRYIDKALTAELIFITSPYSPKELYDNFQTSKRIDRFDQLERRIQTAILVEKDNIFYTHYNNESREYEKDDSNFFTNPFESQSIHRANSFFTQFETTIQRKEQQ